MSDFLKALEDLENEAQTAREAGYPMDTDPYVQTLRRALLIAHTLEQGPDVKMLMAIRKQLIQDMTGPHMGPSAENTFKAMRAQIIKEADDGQ